MTSDEVAVVIHTVYKILFYDWIPSSPSATSSDSGVVVISPNLSIIVHCIQRFLVVVIQECGDELDAEDRSRFSRIFRELLKSSEATHYSDLKQCLDKTRRVYIELWTSMLCLPFGAAGKFPSVVASTTSSSGGDESIKFAASKSRSVINKSTAVGSGKTRASNGARTR